MALWISKAVATETPKERFTLDVACLAANEAAADLPDAFAKVRTDAATMQQLYAVRLQASGPAAGADPESVAAKVEGYRKASVKSIRAPDPDTSRKEQESLAAQVQRCAALPVFENIDKAREGNRSGADKSHP